VRSYGLSVNLGVDTPTLMMDPMDHFHLLVAEDDLIYCFLHFPMLANIPFVLSYETMGSCPLRGPVMSVSGVWYQPNSPLRSVVH
jgi:hypothetical protein